MALTVSSRHAGTFSSAAEEQPAREIDYLIRRGVAGRDTVAQGGNKGHSAHGPRFPLALHAIENRRVQRDGAEAARGVLPAIGKSVFTKQF